MNEQNPKHDSTRKANAEGEARPSRRNFIAPVAAGAAAAAFLKPGQMMAAPVPTISIPKEVAGRMEEPAKVGSFEGKGMSGAEVFAKLCKEEDLAAMFCCPGNYTVINAITAAGVPTYRGRNRRAPLARPPRP